MDCQMPVDMFQKCALCGKLSSLSGYFCIFIISKTLSFLDLTAFYLNQLLEEVYSQTITKYVFFILKQLPDNFIIVCNMTSFLF